MIESNATGTLRIQILEENQKLLEQRQEMSNEVNDRISNQIDSASFAVGAISLFATIGGIFLAVFINKSYEKILKIKQDIDHTKEYIEGHYDQFYEKWKRSDTLDKLHRLINVPEDIANLQQLLFSRDLEPTDFLLLKKAFFSEKLHDYFKKDYILVFQQHFPYQSLKDADLNGIFVEELTNLNAMLYRDTKNILSSIIKFLPENVYGKDFRDKLVVNLFQGLFLSEHKDLISFFKAELTSKNIDIPEIIFVAMNGRTDADFIHWLNS